jgi:predicted Zn finger-like uncharacterized protein
MLAVTCPKCKTVYPVPEDKVGRRGRCKACSEAFTIAAPPAEPALPQPQLATSEQPHQRPKSSPAARVTAVVLVLAAVIAIGAWIANEAEHARRRKMNNEWFRNGSDVRYEGD